MCHLYRDVHTFAYNVHKTISNECILIIRILGINVFEL